MDTMMENLHEPEEVDPTHNDISKEFFDDEGLQRIIVYFSRQPQVGVDDALSNIIITVMTSTVQLKMNKNGVFLFNNTLFIYPFNEMTDRQLAALEKLLKRTEDALTKLPPCLYDNLSRLYGFSITEHMGGSHTINFNKPEKFMINKTDILKAVARATVSLGNSTYSSTLKKHCFSVIIQRVMSLTSINRDVIVHVNNYFNDLMQVHAEPMAVAPAVTTRPIQSSC
jgi:hypothetical protein